MTRDPLGEAGGVNLYGFVGNNPVNFADPFGLVPESDSDMYFWWKLNIPCPDCTAADYERARKYEEEVVLPRWEKIKNKACELAGSYPGAFCFTQDDLTDTDGDGLPDSIDKDDDNDGIPDDEDPDPKGKEPC